MAEFPVIRRVLDLSTAHLPSHLLEDLGRADGVIAYELKYGWLLWVPDDPDGEDRERAPETVLAIQRYAREHGCDYVLLDQDGPIDPNLTIFEHL